MTASRKPKVLLVGSVEFVPKRLRQVEAVAEVVQLDQPDNAGCRAAFQDIVEREGSFLVCAFSIQPGKPSPYPLTKEILEPLVEAGCKLFTGPGAGFDRIDVEYLTSKGVYWANSPNSVGQRTADSTAMMILMALRGTSEQERNMRAGKFMDRTLLSRDARTCTLGIIGLGNIGGIVANHMQHFGMKVVYNKRSKLPAKEEHGCTYVEFDELLRISDVICVTCPLTKATYHLLGAKEFAKMKDNVIIVNTARGAIIDTEAMLDAMDSGKVLRIACDVHEGEPDHVSPRLLAHPRATLTPHCAWVTDTLRADSQTELLDNVEAFIRYGKPNTPVNEPMGI